MQIDKHVIVNLLRDRGKHDQASQVNNTVPDKIDTDSAEHKDLFGKLGVNLEDLTGNLGGLGKFL